MMVMILSVQDCSIAAFTVLEEACDAGHGRRAGAGAVCDIAIGSACGDLPRHLPTLAHCPQFRQRRNVPEEISEFRLRFAGGKRTAQIPEPGVCAPGAFVVTFLGHNGEGSVLARRSSAS